VLEEDLVDGAFLYLKGVAYWYLQGVEYYLLEMRAMF